jgi:hypothetical protein
VKPACCAKEIHDVIRSDDRLWSRQPRSFGGGIMVIEDPEPGEPTYLEMRDCKRCGASMSRPHFDAPPFADEEPTTPAAYVTIDEEDRRWRQERAA